MRLWYFGQSLNKCIFPGANVNSCNNITGANALHIAVESVESPEHFEVLLKCLLDYNIDMNAITLIGDTALNRALLLQK